jgi:hypothetical protein
MRLAKATCKKTISKAQSNQVQREEIEQSLARQLAARAANP